MWISRIRVTGGFLDGLDLTLSDGLNVIIGPRGAGKTSLLELLRHGMGARHADASSEKSRAAFLRAVLGSGEVVIDVEDEGNGRRLVVDAAGGGQRSEMSGSVLVLGQNELEEIASSGASRLNLLDLRAGTVAVDPDFDRVPELTAEIFHLRQQLSERQEESEKRERLLNDRAQLQLVEESLLGGTGAHLTARREHLRAAEERVVITDQDLQSIDEAELQLREILGEVEGRAEQMQRLAERVASVSSAARIAPGIADAVDLARTVTRLLATSRDQLQAARVKTMAANLEARESAAPIREELERAEAGLGRLTAQLRNVEASLMGLEENDLRVRELEGRVRSLVLQREEVLNRVEALQEADFTRRDRVARVTTSQIASNVLVAVDHLADAEPLRNFLSATLRGSSIRSTTIDAVVDSVLPRQLLAIVETGEAGALASVAGIPLDRASKVVEALRRPQALSDLSTVRLLDSVDFRLRDNGVVKSVDQLSTGQKCAVTLPIVLSEKRRTLILDQPEDHLDNAFLVKNVVAGLLDRSKAGAQTIVATHNANIPVLGEARNVVVLASDGTRGQVDSQGGFDTEIIVDRVTSLMEGGREAFARRSAFYLEHGGLSAE